MNAINAFFYNCNFFIKLEIRWTIHGLYAFNIPRRQV